MNILRCWWRRLSRFTHAHRVTVLDNLLTSYHDTVRYIHFAQSDIADSRLLDSLFSQNHFEFDFTD